MLFSKDAENTGTEYIFIICVMLFWDSAYLKFSSHELGLKRELEVNLTLWYIKSVPIKIKTFKC